MKVNQIYEILNQITKETIGESVVLQEDLSNIVDIGNAVYNAEAVDNYVRKLVDHIGRVVVVDRVYEGRAPKVLMDGWEYGAVLEKITSVGLPEVMENEAWELQDKTSYDPNIFYQPKVKAKFFSGRTTFTCAVSYTDKQIKSAFSSAAQMDAFMSMIYNNVKNSITVKNDELVMRTINGAIADTIYDEYHAGSLSSKSGVRAINLLYLYNQATGKALTANNCLYDVDFLRFSSGDLMKTLDRMSNMGVLFNVGGLPRFTPRDRLHVVLHSDYKRNCDTFLQSTTFHNEFNDLPNADLVTHWQGTGKSYAFADTSSINVISPSKNTVQASGIIGVAFDRDALGVTNMDPRVRPYYNPKAEFRTDYHNVDAGYFNDLDENFVVFFVA